MKKERLYCAICREEKGGEVKIVKAHCRNKEEFLDDLFMNGFRILIKAWWEKVGE